MNQALRLPEILDLICTQVDGQADLARLARTSRIWFSPSIARLWYSSINFRHILALIPRTTSDQNGSLINETFPDEFTPLMFERFNLYAPRITSVIVYLRGSAQIPPLQEQIRAINTILRYISGRVLFPRLQSHIIYTYHDNMAYFSDITWLFLLLSSSITNLSMPNAIAFHPQGTPMHFRILEGFLGLVLGTSANINYLCLSLLPRALDDLENDSQASYSSLPLLPRLQMLQLESGLLCAAPLFDWIARLPRLQDLFIVGEPKNTPLPQNLVAQAPPNAFSVLSKIDLFNFELESLSNLWRSAVVRNLTEASIKFSDSLSNRAAATMLPLIALHTPHLHSLTLSSGYLYERDARLPLRTLRSLPLVHLAIFGFHGFKLDFGGSFEVLGRYWPMLESLELDTFTISYQELLKISLIFPKLQTLGLCLPSDPPAVDVDIPSRPLTTSWPNHKFHFVAYSGPLYFKDAGNQLENLGLLLAMAWPNMDFDLEYSADVDCRPIVGPVCESIERNSARILRQAQG